MVHKPSPPENRAPGGLKGEKIETTPPRRERSARPTAPTPINPIPPTSTKPPISAPAKDTSDDESGESDDPFDYAREVERRRAPRKNSQATPRGRKKPSYEAYVVFHGRALGIFKNWAACEISVAGFSGQRYKGYDTVQEAEDAWEHANAVGNVGPITATMAAGPSTHTKFDHILSDEEAYWVVLQGRYPGVYHGLQSAKAAGGKVKGKLLVTRALTMDEACWAFTNGYMEGRVAALPRRGT